MRRIHHRFSSLVRDESGAEAVEFAIVSTVFFMFLIGIAYVGIMVYTNLAVHWALEKGARVAAVNTSTTQTAVATAINGYLNSMGVSSATVTYTVANVSFPVATITASLKQTYSVPLFSNFNITYSANTTVPQGS